jgi:ribonuclease HII
LRRARRFAGLGHERRLASLGHRRIAGVDEVGRGCLAGPVLAAAVVLDPVRPIGGLRDSKQVAPGQRARLARRVAERALACGVGIVEAEEIDRTDILRATKEAMRRAVQALAAPPDFVLVDALTIPGVSIPQKAIVRGDQISASIAAASILAKVYRDGMMRTFHAVYPAYRFDENKGYGTAAHLRALRSHGTTPLHRLTFRGVAAPGGPPAGTARRSV